MYLFRFILEASTRIIYDDLFIPFRTILTAIKTSASFDLTFSLSPSLWTVVCG